MLRPTDDGPEILLAQRPPGEALAGFWEFPGGKLEAGETALHAVVREVREEVGVEVRDIRYFGSQSWAFPHSLMIAFTAEHAGGEIRCEDEEIAEARWFPADALPPLPPSVSIARRLIDATVARLRDA